MIKNPLDLHISNKLRVSRIMAGMSKSELSNLIGVSDSQIKKYEDGTDRVTAGRLYEIAQILKTPIQSFFEDYVDDGYYNFEFKSQKFLSKLSASKDRDLQELIKSFNKIKNQQLRRNIINLIDSITAR